VKRGVNHPHQAHYLTYSGEKEEEEEIMYANINARLLPLTEMDNGVDHAIHHVECGLGEKPEGVE